MTAYPAPPPVRLRPSRLPVAGAVATAVAALFAVGSHLHGSAAPAVARAAVTVAAPAPAVPDGNDAITLQRGLGPRTIHAGAGNDAISAANGVRDVVDCGAGLDTVTADRSDVLRGCEYVTRVEN